MSPFTGPGSKDRTSQADSEVYPQRINAQEESTQFFKKSDEGVIAQSTSKYTMMLWKLTQQQAGTERQPQVKRAGQKVPE